MSAFIIVLSVIGVSFVFGLFCGWKIGYQAGKVDYDPRNRDVREMF